ncbi:MAG: cation:proton antiporter [Pseudomonadota bacterium]|nr:cation:proton antiporter [Pseudomonadota bacterium]
MHHGIWTTILGLFGLLTIAVLMLPLSKRLKFPYTVQLAVVGILLGLLVPLAGDVHLGPVTDLLHAFQSFEITSEVIIFVFLPALVFESSLAIDVRKLLADVRPIMFLAVIGLLISAFMVGGAVWAVSAMPFVVCLLLGAILSATDPVAVVAIFKDLGAPKRLAVLVEGESLFNDATAIVLFNIVAAMIIGATDADLIGGAFDFVKVFIGGIIVGFVMARLFAWLIGRMGGMPLVEVTLTLSLAYLSFLVAEHYLHVSGVMAVVTAALVMGSFGRTAVSGPGWHLMQETWETLGFWANSLIFILVGLAVPGILAVFDSRMVLVLVVLLLSAFVARAVLTHGLLPMLSRAHMAAEVSMGYRTVMLWGGLRGAVSLALALAIHENHAIPQDIREFVVALVCAFVLFTLFVNATTVSKVMQAFGLDKLSPADRAIRDRAIASALETIAGQVQRVAEERQITADVSTEVETIYRDRVRAVRAETEAGAALGPDDWLKIGLMATLGQERRGYMQQYAQGYLGSSVTRALVAANDELLDATKAGGIEGYRRGWHATTGFDQGFRLAFWLQRRFNITGPLGRGLAVRLEALGATTTVLADLKGGGLRDIEALVGKAAAEQLADLLAERLHRTRAALDAGRRQYPDYAVALQRRYLEQVAIRQERLDYDRLHDEAVIGAEIHSSLRREVDERYAELGRPPVLDLGLEPAALIRRVPLFQGLDEGRIAKLAALLKPRLVVPGEKVCGRGDAGDAMYFVSSGAVRVDVSPNPVTLGSGDFFGELALLRDAPRTADVVAEGFCDLLILERGAFQKLLDDNPDLRQTIERVAAERLKG